MMVLSLTDFEGLFTGLGVIVVLCASLVYLFRPGMPESILHDSSTKKNILTKSGKKEFQKKKKKVKKRTEQNLDEPDDSISESSNTSTVLNALPPSPVLPNSLSSETQPLPLHTEEAPINQEQQNLYEAGTKEEDGDEEIELPADMRLKLNFPSEESLYPTTNSVEMENEQSTQDILTADWFTSENEVKLEAFEAPEVRIVSAHASNKSKKRIQKKGGDQHPHRFKGITHSTGYSMHLASVDTFLRPPPMEKFLTNLSTLTDMQTKVKYLEKLIKQNKADLEMSRQENARVKADNTRLRTENEEATRNLHTLEANVSELTEKNTTLTGDMHFLETKFKSLDSSYLQLRSQLNTVNMEAASQKTMAEKQAFELRQHITNLVSANRAQAANNKELMHAQEVLANENQLLTARYERQAMEVQQLRKTNTIQLLELQNIRNSRDAYATNQVMWEEQRKETRNNMHKLSLRNGTLEMQLQQCTNELDLANKQTQEFASALASLQTETAHRMDQDQLQSKVISSLKYQFEELNSEKQRLSDAMLAAEASCARSAGELRARIVRLKCELAEALATSNANAERADQWAAKYDALLEKQSKTVDDGETVITSLPIVAKSQKMISDADKIAFLEAARIRAVQEAQEAREQQALMETTLMETESVLARLQRSIEEEEAHWRNLLLSSDLENARLKNELERIMRDGCAAFEVNGCATSNTGLKTSNGTDQASVLKVAD